MTTPYLIERSDILVKKLEATGIFIVYSIAMARTPLNSLDVLFVAIFAVMRHQDTLRQHLESLIGFAIVFKTATVITALFMTLQIIRFTRGLRRDSTLTDGFPLKPMFFPCRTSHRRMFPKTHSFAYSYLLVGIPVRWVGSVGGMLSVDEASTTPWYTRWFSLHPWRPWYSVNADDYHVRGHVHGGLDEKLRDYLTSQGADYKQYAHAYLLTAARFLGYSFNPISIWYLYSSTRELRALVLEVNNTFNERHSYFLEPRQSVSKDRPTRYGGTWNKDFFVSPFNSRDGSYSISTNDPFYPKLKGGGKINMSITLSTQSKPMLIARLDSTTLPLDPVSMTSYDKTMLLAAWWWTGLATFFPRTIKEAFNLQFRRGMKLLSRPEPRNNTMSRHADKIELCIEGLFRKYLREVVFSSNEAISVRYISAGLSGVDGREEVILSPSAQLGASMEEAVIKILTPLFYSRVVQYPDFHNGVFEELNNATISICNPDSALEGVFNFGLHAREPLTSSLARLEKDSRVMSAWWNNLLFPVLARYKRPPMPISNPDKSFSEDIDTIKSIRLPPDSSLDEYIHEHGTNNEKREYAWGVLKLLLARKIAYGWMEILDMEILGLRVLIAWVLMNGVGLVVGT